MSKFMCHLHNHTDLSKMDSTNKIDKFVKKAKEMGYKSLAITDHGTISGWIDFELACDKNNIKPIFGVEGYEKRESDILNTTNVENIRYYHSLFLAKNKKGAQVLMKLVTEAYKLSNFYYKPRYSVDFLWEHKDEIKGNIVWSSACVGGRLPKLLLRGKDDEAQKYYETMVEIFGKEDCYIEVQNHGDELETKARELLIKFARKNDAKLLATNDIHYLYKKDYISREILIARSGGKTIREREELGKIYVPELYLKSPKEMDLLFKDCEDALTNTFEVMNKCESYSFKGEYWHYPKMDMPEGYTSDTYLRKLTFDAFNEKFPSNTLSKENRDMLIERIDLELDVMSKMDASAYMLIDADFTKAARDMMRVGPGRGSACGSVVAELLSITEIDPLKYDLFFERKLAIYCARKIKVNCGNKQMVMLNVA